MSFLGGAETVLRSAKKPLTAAEITEIALRRGLIKTRGKTPAATMSAALDGRPVGVADPAGVYARIYACQEWLGALGLRQEGALRRLVAVALS